jgi:hypothetical protein
MAGWTEREDGTPISEARKPPKQKEALSENRPVQVTMLASRVQWSVAKIMEAPRLDDAREKTRSALTELKWEINPKISIYPGGSRKVDLSSLQRVMPKIADHISMSLMLFGKWSGKTIDMPREVMANPRKNIDDAWQKKLKLYGGKNSSLMDFYTEKVLPYVRWEKEFRPISRKAWDEKVANAIRTTQKDLDLSRFFSENPEKNALMRSIVSKIWVAEMNSVTFAELIDSKNPERAEAFFNTILENFGDEFLYLFPALGDAYLSYGPAQLTKYAVADDGGIGILQKRFMNGGKMVPNNMNLIHSEDHHLGGYRFSLYNIYHLIKDASPKQVHIFWELLKRNSKDTMNKLAQYIAASHNSPSESRKKFLLWIDEGLTGRHLEDRVTRPTAQNNAEKARIHHSEQVASVWAKKRLL